MERLIETYAQADLQDPQAICNHLWDQLSTFQGNAAQYDDVTMIVIGSDQ